MRDAGKIIGGLIIFVVLMTSPLWFNAFSASSVEPPELGPPPNGSEECVEAVEYMRAFHMDLLNEWRDAVVRNGYRYYVASDGTKHKMSLTLTCLDCHTEKSRFCDRCHEYAGVGVPYCWDCHVDPKGGR